MRNAVRSAVLLAAALVTGCATEPVTTLEASWVTPQVSQLQIKKLLIITVAANEFVQIAVQDQLAAQLKARGMNAVASKRYFTRYTEAEKARFKKSIDESDADFVLLARVTRTEQTSRQDSGVSLGETEGALAVAFGRYASYAAGADHASKTVTAEASIYARKGEKGETLVWTARTKTTNPQVTTGEGYAPQYVEVMLDAMKKDKLF